MKAATLIGLVIAGVILAAWFLAPTLQSATVQADADAVRQAEGARRLLDPQAGYSPHIARLGLLIDDMRFEQAELSAYSEDAEAALTEALGEGERGSLAAKVKSGFRAGNIAPAIQTAQQAIEQNASLLKAALEQSGQAAGADAPAFAHLVHGSAKLQAAEARLLEAGQAWQELGRVMRNLEEQAARYRGLQVSSQYYEDLEIRPVIETFQQGEYSISGLEQELAETRETITNLTNQIDSRAAELADVRARMKELQRKQTQLVQTGYEMGNESAFAEYRERYLDLAAQLRELEGEEQTLLHGRRVGAEFADGDPADGPILGGEMVLGIEALKNQRALQESRAQQLQEAIAQLATRVDEIEANQRSLQAEVSDYATRLQGLREEIDALQTEASTLVDSAAGANAAALDAAIDARAAFRQATSALNAMQRDARQRQSERDPERQNELLTRIVNDRMLTAMGESAEAAARVVEGRIQLERLTELERYLRASNQVAEMIGGTFDGQQTQAAIDASRTEGLEALQAAFQLYNDQASAAGPTRWIPQTAMGTVVYLQSKLEPDDQRAEQMALDAADMLWQACSGAEENPLLADAVLFRDYLRAKTGYQPPMPGAEAPETDTPE